MGIRSSALTFQNAAREVEDVLVESLTLTPPIDLIYEDSGL